jgi:hypothetical protein
VDLVCSYLLAPSAHFRSPQIKKTYGDTALRDRALPRLPRTFLSTTPPVGLPLHRRHASTAMACSPLGPHRHCCLAARGHTHLTVVVGSTVGAAHLGLCSRPPAVILLLHRDCIVESRCAMLHSPDCQVLLKAHVASVCFKCFKSFRGMLHVF